MTKRSLIMAGGGVKVAFQAGVLQVWLDEAGLTFDHADGASGGTFNLAMWAQGMSGRAIADAWRRTDPADGVSLNVPQLTRLAYARSLFTLDAYRRHVFPTWGLDWTKIRASPRVATFNTYNFSKHRLEVFLPARMDEDSLCACVSLPMWFPPVNLGGDTYIDAVYVTDGNVEEAIRRGADEIWVIWTVSTQGIWNDGFVANYFQVIEAAANGRFNIICERIASNNAAIAAGQLGEFGRTITLRVLRREVPIHYLVNFSQDRLVECVNLGVEEARRWCKEEGIAFTPGPESTVTGARRAVSTSLAFTEQMKGALASGETDPARGLTAGMETEAGTASMRVTIDVVDVDRFVTEPAHEGKVSGWVEASPLGGRVAVEDGTFNLFVDDGNPHRKLMVYRLHLRDVDGRPRTLLGRKEIQDDPRHDPWSDTTTLFTRIFEGHLPPGGDAGAVPMAAGVLRVHMADFLEGLGTFKVEGGTLGDRSRALARFGALFLGSLWDVYASHVLTFAPF